jgi:hypothetical protein
VNNIVHLEHGIGMRCGLRSLDTAALVDTDVHDDRAGLHVTDHIIGYQERRACTMQEHSTDQQISILDMLVDILRGRQYEIQIG